VLTFRFHVTRPGRSLSGEQVVKGGVLGMPSRAGGAGPAGPWCHHDKAGPECIDTMGR
jgi:hypothetical protein